MDQAVLIKKNFEANRYDLEMNVDLDNYTFEADLKIEVDILENTSTITLNQIGLEFKTITFIQASESLTTDKWDFDKKEEQINITAPKELKTGEKYTLQIKQSGKISESLKGLQKARQTDLQGNKTFQATTQFEPYYARMMLPCLDEPQRKSIFKLTVETATKQNVLFNMPELSSSQIDEKTKRVEFMETPKMSTYLIALIIGEFDFVQTQTARGTRVRIQTPLKCAHQGKFALEECKKTLELYEDWFKLKYPLPKMDMIAISDFEAGAMENWGLITQRETDLLIDSKTAGVRQLTRVSTVINHELAHQWFGNLVTMKWWTDLWLNESFATFIETLATEHFHPEQNHLESFVGNTMLRAMGLDCLSTSHPISVPIKRVQEVDEIFDAISQTKGCSVMKMFQHQMGHDKMMEGLVNQFKKQQQGNTEKMDLLKEWEAVMGNNLCNRMLTWIDKMGFPLLTVTDEVFGEKEVSMTINQRYYLENGAETDPALLWFIPLYVYTDAGEQLFELSEADTTIKVKINSKDSFVKINQKGKSQCRVMQGKESQKRIVSAVVDGKLGSSDNATILSDYLSLMKSDKVDLADFVLVLKAFTNVSNTETLDMIITAIGTIKKYVFDEEVRKLIDNYKFMFLKDLYKKLGITDSPDDSAETKKLRGTILGSIATINKNLDAPQTELESYLKSELELFLTKPNDNNINNDIKPAIIFQGLNELKDEAKLQEWFDLYFKLESNQDRRILISNLGVVDPQLIDQVVKFSYEKAQMQDRIQGIINVCRVLEVYPKAWDQFVANYQKILADFGENNMIFAQVLEQNLCMPQTQNEADKRIAWMDANPDDRYKMKQEQFKETLKNNIKYYNKIQSTMIVKQEFWVNTLKN